MHYNFKKISVCGSIHSAENIKNQDAVMYRSKGNIGVIALADGAGSRRNSDLGAEISVNFITDYILTNFNKLVKMRYEEIQKQIIEELMKKLREACIEHGSDLRELGSTLLFAACDGGQYITGHLGDGCIVSYKGEKYTVISFPENLKNEYSTVLTTSFNSQDHLRIQKRSSAYSEGIILLSDGMEKGLFYNNYKKKSEGFILNTELYASELSDDASYVMMNWSDEN